MNATGVIDSTKKPPYSAYKEPWFWAVIAPLILVFGVSSVLVFFAIDGRDDRVVGDYYKQGRMINNRFLSEDLARQLNVSGKISFNAASGYVALQLRGQSRPEDITLTISHPAKAHLDYRITLPKTGTDLYEGKVTERLTGRRYIIISAQSSFQELPATGALGYDATDTAMLTTGGADIERLHWRISTEMNFDHSESILFNSRVITPSSLSAAENTPAKDKWVQ